MLDGYVYSQMAGSGTNDDRNAMFVSLDNHFLEWKKKFSVQSAVFRNYLCNEIVEVLILWTGRNFSSFLEFKLNEIEEKLRSNLKRRFRAA